MDRSQAAVLKAFLGNMQPCQSMYQGQTESEFFRLKKVLSIRLDSLRNVFHCFPSFPNPSGSPSVLSRWRVSPSLFFLSVYLSSTLSNSHATHHTLLSFASFLILLYTIYLPPLLAHSFSSPTLSSLLYLRIISA